MAGRNDYGGKCARCKRRMVGQPRECEPGRPKNGIRPRKLGSHQTPRWREVDSNPRSPQKDNDVILTISLDGVRR
jgi:hypothetical protein